MNRLGLDDDDWDLYLEACAQPHEVKLSVDLMDNNDDVVISFDQGSGNDRDVAVTDGSVLVDANSAVGRVLDLTVADPKKQLIVSEDANYTDRQLRVTVGVQVPALARVVDAVVFTGPIVAAPRSGDVVQFTAHGRARFSMHDLDDVYTVKKGTRKTDAIKRMLHDLAGEPYANMGDIPDLAPRLGEDMVLHLTKRPWPICRQWAESMNRHLTYGGPGRVRFQRTDLTESVYTFAESLVKPGIVTDQPIVQTDWSTVRNGVIARGGATRTQKAPVAYARADPSNPFSAQKLGRGDSLCRRWDEVTHPSIHLEKELQRVADATLARDLIGNREVKYASIPMYIFDELDLVAVETRDITAQTHLTQFLIPLNLQNSPGQSYNFLKRIASDPFAGRRR